MAPLLRFSIVQLLQVVLIIVNVVVVVQGQKHDAYRTCAIRQNEIVTLIYNSIQNRYIPYNENETVSNSSTTGNYSNNSTYDDQNNNNNNNNIMKNDTSTRRRTNRRRLTVNMDTILNESSTMSSSSSSTLSPWYVRWMNQVVGTVTARFAGMIDTYNNVAIADIAEPAIAVPTTLFINQIPREASEYNNNDGSRRHLQLSSSSSGFQYRADSDRIHHIDPNIVLHEPYDGRMVDVRVCDCSSSGTWNNNNNYRDAFNVNYTFYCPINKSYCYVPRVRKGNAINGSIYQQYPYYYHPVCISAPTINSEVTVSMIRPMAFASLLLLIVVSFISPIGQHVVRGCCCRCLFYCRCCFRRRRQRNPTNNNNDNKNNSYNQYYSNYLLQNKPKIAERYIKQYIKERQDRWNVRYQQLQQLHGELPKNDDDENDVNFSSNNNNDGCNTSNGIHPPLDGLEELIVRDIYYYRPSLLLRTRIYKGQQHTSTSSATTVLTTTTTFSTKSTVSSPYDLDDDNVILNVDHTVDHQDDNIPIGNSNNNNTIITKATSSENEGGCIICFTPIDIGCKVGVLPECQHIFHSNCLKVWLKQRNVCPLCLTTDVAIDAYSYKSSYDHHPIEEQQVESEEDQQQQNTTITSSPMSSSTTLPVVDSTYP